MIRILALLMLVALIPACGGSAAPDSADPHAARPGLWETQVRVGDLSASGVPTEEAANLAAALGEANPPSRSCLPGGTPRVGAPILGCTYTSVSDRGERAERVATCPRRGDSIDVIEISGSRSAERYSLRILSRRTDAATGRTLRAVETIEEGRWVGPCPGGSAEAEANRGG